MSSERCKRILKNVLFPRGLRFDIEPDSNEQNEDIMVEHSGRFEETNICETNNLDPDLNNSNEVNIFKPLSPTVIIRSLTEDVFCVNMEENVRAVDCRKARKKPRIPENWKRAKEKVERYSAKQLPSAPQCNHANSSQYKCGSLSMQDMQQFHEQFYKYPIKKDQDAFILKHCKIQKTKRRRPRKGIRKPTEIYTKLYVRKKNSAKLIPVCQKTFLGILQITVHRVRRVAKEFAKSGTVVQEKRGGDHRSAQNEPKLRAVRTFIETFKCVESHYCRSSTMIRKYLPAELNIKKMWRMYQHQCQDENLLVRHCYFRRVFNRHYNLGFGTPRTDTCSKCTELLEKIKNSRDQSEKSKLMAEKRVHSLKAQYFYRLLKEKADNMITLSFDCQKNQVLPKISDQTAYYSRQLYIYNFGTVLSMPDNTLNKNNVFLYVWTEDQQRKGANEIASAVFHRLQNLEIKENVDMIRLVSDGCGAQNKNTVMIGMVGYWLLRHAHPQIKSVEFVFPIPGHSFLPPDRVFGNIEKEIKKNEEIIDPETYINIFDRYGTVVKMEDKVMDWKNAFAGIIKPPASWHFKFAQCKRFYLKRTASNILVRGEMHYATDMIAYKSILKKRKSWTDVNPRNLQQYDVVVKRAKISDVDNLLKKHFGTDWKDRDDLTYYKEVLSRSEARDGQAEEYEEEVCEGGSDSELRI
ncbi:unnamed protein product [Diatraea saccharalis]|uniref:Uncharacterized protein n=1 Tax=Diatraea saccharalis TaxID=40085 RepID=A0A9N9WFR5_9NEOP|nr:unnamed protein product [Diatraea saccharalis]